MVKGAMSVPRKLGRQRLTRKRVPPTVGVIGAVVAPSAALGPVTGIVTSRGDAAPTTIKSQGENESAVKTRRKVGHDVTTNRQETNKKQVDATSGGSVTTSTDRTTGTSAATTTTVLTSLMEVNMGVTAIVNVIVNGNGNGTGIVAVSVSGSVTGTGTGTAGKRRHQRVAVVPMGVGRTRDIIFFTKAMISFVEGGMDRYLPGVIGMMTEGKMLASEGNVMKGDTGGSV